MTKREDNRLGEYLRLRREKLDPVALGFALGRRRTPGLRREEVALRANISPAWYVWLEQGRGGAASADVLNRLAHALMLTDIEREHLFLLGLGRPPEVHYQGRDYMTSRLQRLLDAMPYSPAVVKTATWEVLAWNRAAALVLTDYGQIPVAQRNILKLLFLNTEVHSRQPEWTTMARSVVAAFRVDVSRAGADKEIEPLVAELCNHSPEFAAIWQDKEIQSFEGIVKRVTHPVMGLIALEYSSLSVDGRPDLALAIYNPVTERDRQAIQALIQMRE